MTSTDVFPDNLFAPLPPLPSVKRRMGNLFLDRAVILIRAGHAGRLARGRRLCDVVTMQHTRNLRVESVRPLLSPAILLEEIPLEPVSVQTVTAARRQISQILSGADDRLLAVVGPCSIHDP